MSAYVPPKVETLRELDIDGTYRLAVEQWEGQEPALFVVGCDCAAVVETPDLARRMAAFLTVWADEEEARRG